MMIEPNVQGFRLSPQQRHLWLLQQDDKGQPYRVQSAVLIDGELDAIRLRDALRRVVNKHEALRTRFKHLPGVAIPLQVITSEDLVAFEVHDETGRDPAEQNSKIDSVFEETRRLIFDLRNGPVLHSTLIKLSRTRQVLIITMPALCGDAATMSNLVNEIIRHYSMAQAGDGSVLQYVDFSEFLNQLQEAEETRAGSGYWKRQNISESLTVKLPFERRLSETASFSPQVVTLPVSSNALAMISEVARENGASVSDLLLASWQALLWRLTGESEIVIGINHPGRNYEGLDDALGLFAKYLPVQGHVSDGLTFNELMRTTREDTREAYQWQEYFSWEHVRDSDGKPVNLSASLIGFDYEERSKALSAGEITYAIYKQYACIDRFKLRLSCARRADDLILEFYYDQNLFSNSGICCLAEQYQALIQTAIARPDMAISNLELLNEAERHRLLVELNDTASRADREICVHESFEAQAGRTPDATAIVYKDSHLSYAELNARANQLARQLRELGVMPDMLVALCVEPSAEMVIGILAILKAGAAYVPLDPSYPSERLAFMLEHSRAPVVLTERRLNVELPTTGAAVVYLDEDSGSVFEGGREDLKLKVLEENLAYMIYTSGSTGRPKGVMIPHRALANHMAWIAAKFSINGEDVVLQKTPFSFDASVWEFYAPLLTGGRLVLAQAGGHRDGAYIVDLIKQEQVSLLQVVPSQLRIYQSEAEWSSCTSLRQVFCGGEPLGIDLVDQYFASQRAPLCNLYGPTEATIDTTYFACEAGAETATAPIGEPVDNVQVYLLDEQLRPVPAGIPGELYVGGEGLGRGYASEPSMTADKFIPNPFGQTPGARLYKSGDFARYLPDGQIEFLGRKDTQIKVRGFRLELGEIEATLSRHPAVRQSVVVVREVTPGDSRVVAYVISNQHPFNSDAELRSFLQSKLPDYMIPSAFVSLNALPLTPSGKVDTRALPLPTQYSTTPKPRAINGPRNVLEEVLVEIFSSVLGVEQVGIEDNFFELGGHSLIATMVVSRAREAFQVEVPLQWMFDEPTVEALAAKVESAIRAAQGLARPPLTPVTRGQELPLSFAQERLWFTTMLAPESATYNLPNAFCIDGPLNPAALEQAIGEIVRRHEALRTTFSVSDGRPIQIIAPPRRVPLLSVDLSGLAEPRQLDEVKRLVRQEAQKPFDLNRDLMLRATLFGLGRRDYILSLTTHHISSDAWSRGVLLREMAALYEAYVSGSTSSLGELQVQYADYAVWQRQWLQGEVLQSELDYWKGQIEGSRPELDLPMKQPRMAGHPFPASAHSLGLSASLTEGLRALSRREGVTLFMTLLTAFKVLLYRYTGQQDISVGTAVTNRSRGELEGLIGFFINMLVIRTDFSGANSFRQLLNQVRQATLGAYAHQDLPYEKLVEELHPERNTGHTGLFTAAFGFMNAMHNSLEIPGLTVKAFRTETGAGKFDLTLIGIERDNGLSISMEYNAELFDGILFKTMMTHFQRLLEEVVSNPDLSIHSVTLLSEAERQQLLLDWNDTRADYPAEICVHELFEAQARQTPDAIAMTFNDDQISYRLLNERANQLAHYLRGLGVEAESRVCVCLERSPDLIVALIGILKAGGAYVPLDPSYPSERIALMLEDAGAAVLLTESKLAGELRPQLTKVVRLDAGREAIASNKTDNLSNRAVAENLAYVIYTSGSTGRPKGVAVSHRAINRLVFNSQFMAFGPSERIAQASNSSFDAATFEIWGALLHGARLVGVAKDVALSPRDLARQIRTHEISSMFLTTALFNQIAYQAPSAFNSIHNLLFGGEAVEPRWVQRVLENGPPRRLLHVYGPTESTTFSSWHLVSQLEDKATTVPIGRPIGNTQAYGLDADMQPVAIGVLAELYIGGDGLARGYLNRPELTAEKLVPNPFSDEPGQRLYRTGDLVRFTSDGQIKFVGRIDYQVKIRGFRIEPGEIEAAIEEHPAVQQAVVIAHKGSADDKQIVAYIVGSRQSPPSAGELRQYLKERLPDYMVPAAFIILDSLPLTPNGKVDRRALPEPDKLRQEEVSYMAPHTEMEQLVASVWKSVLQVDKVGIQDNFFDLGGHSLLLIRVHNELRSLVQRDIAIIDLFDYPTVHALARFLSQEEGEQVSVKPRADLGEKKREGQDRLSQRRTRVRATAKEQAGD